MVLVGVSIEDNTVGGYNVYAIALKGDVKGGPLFADGASHVTKINTILPIGPDGDLEGLGTNLNNIVYAITESDTPNLAYKNVQGVESKIVLKGARFGDDAGADFAPTGFLYNIQGNDELANGPIGSQLYKVNVNTGVVAKVGGFSKEFHDGLAINKNVLGGVFGIASDFESADGDGDELYKINLTTGAQTFLAKAKFVDFDGVTPIPAFDSDSGVAFTPDGKWHYAIEDNTNDLFKAKTADVLDGGFVTFTRVNDDLPNAGKAIGEFEGLAIADLPVSLPIPATSSSLFNTEAGQDVLTAAAATMFDSTAISSI